MKYLKYVLIVAWLLSWGFHVDAQISPAGQVKDAVSGQALPFGSVVVTGNMRGTITDENGFFQLNNLKETDTLFFSYLGYQGLVIPAGEAVKRRIFSLAPLDVALSEVLILEDKSLYNLVASCRDNLVKTYSTQQSKAYYKIASESNHQPVELVEAYYNAKLTGEKIDYLDFKTGRAVLDTVDGNYWNSMDISKVISQFDLCEINPYLPYNPLNFRKAKLKELYHFKLIYSDESHYQLEFTPNQNPEDYFRGKIWISRDNHQLLKIQLQVNNTSRYPFAPMSSCDSIKQVNLAFTSTYQLVEDKSRLVSTYFDYDLMYHSNRDSTCPLFIQYRIPPPYKKTIRPISSRMLLYLYDYEELFILPYFEYPVDRVSDYLLILIMPYHERFWNDNPSILTNEQKSMLSGEDDRSNLFYLGERQNGLSRHSGEYDFSKGLNLARFHFWNNDKRIIINGGWQAARDRDISWENVQALKRYDLYAQILLDVNPIGDSIYTQSCAVFDSWRSYFIFQEDDYTDIFINLFFDICEIERREMQQKLDNQRLSIYEIDKLFANTKAHMQELTTQYLKEVDRGANLLQLQKWNHYVEEKLGINNMKMFMNQVKY